MVVKQHRHWDPWPLDQAPRMKSPAASLKAIRWDFKMYEGFLFGGGGGEQLLFSW